MDIRVRRLTDGLEVSWCVYEVGRQAYPIVVLSDWDFDRMLKVMNAAKAQAYPSMTDQPALPGWGR